jgi:hypothetical protein
MMVNPITIEDLIECGPGMLEYINNPTELCVEESCTEQDFVDFMRSIEEYQTNRDKPKPR